MGKEKLSKFKVITLERTGCLGFCPVYEIKITCDGLVHYLGRAFVEKIGEYNWNIDNDSLKALNKAIMYYEYFFIEKRTPVFYMTCNPYCITSVLLKDGTYRKIKHYLGDDSYPKKLFRFEDKINKIVKIEQYISKSF